MSCAEQFVALRTSLVCSLSRGFNFERLIKRFKYPEADKGCDEDGEGSVDVCVSFVADNGAPKLIDPGEGALDNPAVSAEPLAALDAAAGDAGHDPASSQVTAAALEVATPGSSPGQAIVGLEFRGSLSGSPSFLADGVDRIDLGG